MRASKLITLVVMSVLLVALNATAGQAKTIRWRSIVGIVEAANRVGSGDLGFGGSGVLGLK